MINKLTICFGLLMLSATLPAAEPVLVASTAKEVIIYKKGAQITRAATASIGAGRTELVFKDLSKEVLEKSIQLKSNDALTILSVGFRLNFLDVPGKTKEIERLEEEVEGLNLKIQQIKVEQNIYQQEENLLAKNQAQIVGIANTPLKTQDLKELADFQRARLKELLGLQFDLSQTLKKLEKQLIALKNQYNSIHAKSGESSGEIVVVVQSAKAMSAAFTLQYYVSNAGWAPVYDVRVKDITSPVQLFQKANLYQLSGEQWNNVKLSLSTGDPSENGIRPILYSWNLYFTTPYARERVQTLGGRYQVTGTGRSGEVKGRIVDDSGEPLVGANITVQGASYGTVTDINGEFKLNVSNPNSILVVSYTGYSSLTVPVGNGGQVFQVYLSSAESMLSEVVVVGYSSRKRKQLRDKTEAAPPAPPPVTVVQLPTTYLYEIDIPITLSSDGKLQLVDIKNYEFPAEYRYYCTPKLDLSAYLTAQMTGWETVGLLSGEANLFFEGTYLGKSFLEFASTEDTLELSLGRDRNIVVSRTKLKDYTKKTLFGGKKEDSRMFEIAVKNKKTQAITLVIEDQFPISTNKEIDIERSETSDGEVEENTGIISWTLPLESAAEKKVRFGYKVKYPKTQRITLE